METPPRTPPRTPVGTPRAKHARVGTPPLNDLNDPIDPNAWVDALKDVCGRFGIEGTRQGNVFDVPTAQLQHVLGRMGGLQDVRAPSVIVKQLTTNRKPVRSTGGFMDLCELAAVVQFQFVGPCVYSVLATNHGDAFVLMEKIVGQSLRQHLIRANGQLSITINQHMHSLITQMAARGLYHKDLNPDNIFVTPLNKLKVIDFGISASFDATNNQLRDRAIQRMTRDFEEHVRAVDRDL